MTMQKKKEYINQLFHEHFDKVIVLTVDRFQERQQKIRERLKGIDFEFFYGVDKNELSDEFIEENYQHDRRNTVTVNLYAKPLNKGEIACALSHREIYHAMTENNWKRLLIFEDDVIPDDQNLSLLPGVFSELPGNWELLYLGYLKNERINYGKQLKQAWYKIQGGLGLTKLPYSMIKNLLPRPLSAHLLRAGYHDCTHAYAVHIEAAKKIIKLQTPVRYRADNAISHLVLKDSIHAFTCTPPLFHQEVFIDKSSKSYIR